MGCDMLSYTKLVEKYKDLYSVQFHSYYNPFGLTSFYVVINNVTGDVISSPCIKSYAERDLDRITFEHICDKEGINTSYEYWSRYDDDGYGHPSQSWFGSWRKALKAYIQENKE